MALANPTCILSTSGNLTLNGILSGTGGLAAVGPGLVTLTASNSYSGVTTVNGGTLEAVVAGSIPSGGSISVNGGQLTLDASQTFGQLQSAKPRPEGGNIVLANGSYLTVNPAADVDSFYGNISGSGGLIKGGSSHLRLFGQLSYTGSTTVGGSGGVLVLQGTGTVLPAGTLLTVNSPAEVDLTGGNAAKTDVISGLAGNGSIYSTTYWGTLDINVALGQTYTYAGNLTTNGAGEYVIKDGPGTQVLGGIQSGAGGTVTVNAGNLIVSGSNTYTGLTTIAGGTLEIGNGTSTGAIDASSGVVNNGLLLFNRSNNASFSLAVSGSGNLVQSGSPGATLTLTSGGNSYTGSTTIANSSVLALGASGSIANSPTINIAAGAVFDVHLQSAGYTVPAGQTIAGDGTINGSVKTGLGSVVAVPAIDANSDGALHHFRFRQHVDGRLRRRVELRLHQRREQHQPGGQQPHARRRRQRGRHLPVQHVYARRRRNLPDHLLCGDPDRNAQHAFTMGFLGLTRSYSFTATGGSAGWIDLTIGNSPNTAVWTGNSSTLWSDTGNWSGGASLPTARP